MRALSAAFALALLAPQSQTITDEVFQIPAKEWRYVAVAVKRVPVTVKCAFHVLSGAGEVRVALLNADGLEEWKQGKRDAPSAGTPAREGGFRRPVSLPDEYAVIVENGGRSEASVRLQVSLDFSEQGQPQARYVSPQRRLAVIAISATVFFAIVSCSAKKLLGVMRN